MNQHLGAHRPSLQELGDDLRRISAFTRWRSLAAPFAWASAYFLLASFRWWAPAVFCLVALSFATYGSVSHDLVHQNLGLRRRTNKLLLVLIELLALRSGTAYQLSHLHHHRRYPSEDDVEGAAASMTLFGALLEGVIFQPKIYLWAWRQRPRNRNQLALEGALIAAGYLGSVVCLRWSVIPCAYTILMTLGAWIIPLITSYVPHNPHAREELQQTRAFRGIGFSVIALEHLYHLEHHLYPAVPHHHWPELARRLDPYLQANGVRPVRLWR